MEPWDVATAGLTSPLSVVDLDAFDANAADLELRLNKARSLLLQTEMSVINVALAWAASLVAALGVGWMTRDLFRPEQVAISPTSIF